MNKIQVFISYSSANHETALKICEYLEQNGKECWIAPRNIPIGTDYGEAIITGIESSNALILLFSEASNKSQHVLREVERAVSKRIPVISYRMDDTVVSKSMEYFLLANQWLDTTSEPEMLRLLNKSVETVALSDEDKALLISTQDNQTEKRSGNRSVSLILGIIAVGIFAISAVLLITRPFNKETDKPSVTPTGSLTAAPTVTPIPAMTKISEECFLKFGKYYPTGYNREFADEGIVWQILEVDYEQKTVLMISDKVIDIKPFDCAESGKYDETIDGTSYHREQRDEYTAEQMKEFRGSNVWADSDLRAWLNASGRVLYNSKSQDDRATDEYGNGFADQQGFLSKFEETELSRLCEVTLEDGTTSKVWIPSMDEVELYRDKTTFMLHPWITKSAAASDETSWYQALSSTGVSDYIWVTRTPGKKDSTYISVVYCSSYEELYVERPAAASGLGIRPVIKISLSDCELDGTGTDSNPYIIKK